jgi:hypothetical protein
MCSEQSFDNHDSFYVPSLAMVQLTWDTTASVHPSEVKAFLSGNHRDFGTQVVRKALEAAGIEKYFAEARNFLGWYGSLPN